MGHRITGLRAIALGALVALGAVTIPAALVVGTAPSTPAPVSAAFSDVVLPAATMDPDTDESFESRLPEAELEVDALSLAAKGSAPMATWTAKVPPVVTNRPARERPLAAKAVIKPKPAPAPERAASASGVRAKIVQIALAQLGDRYVSGGTGPDTFDCSGLVRYAYQVAGVSGKLGGGHSASAMYAWGLSQGLTSRSNPRVGDVVIYGGGSHAGIYIGNGKIVSALNPSQGIRITGLHALGAPFTTFIHTRI